MENINMFSRGISTILAANTSYLDDKIDILLCFDDFREMSRIGRFIFRPLVKYQI